MSDRLISAEKLAEILREQWCDECMTDDCYYCNIYQIKEIIRNMPTVDAEPVRHGQWEVVDEAEPRRYGCSYCKRLSYDTTKYCSYCGARMDGERREDGTN